MTQVLNFPAGSAITFSSGEYSDFGNIATIVTLAQCDLPKLVKRYIAEYKPENDWDTPGPEGFPSWLVMQSLAMPADVSGVHLGSYGDFDSEFTRET